MTALTDVRVKDPADVDLAQTTTPLVTLQYMEQLNLVQDNIMRILLSILVDHWTNTSARIKDYSGKTITTHSCSYITLVRAIPFGTNGSTVSYAYLKLSQTVAQIIVGENSYLPGGHTVNDDRSGRA